MKTSLIAALSILLTAPAFGMQTTTAPGALILEAANASPQTQAAKSAVTEARAAAGRLRAGEYEVQLTGSVGQRTAEDALRGDLEYTEWSAGLSRAVRLPGKRGTDRDLADIGIALAEARYAKTRQEVMLNFAELWAEWNYATDAAEMSRRLAEDAERIAGREDKSLELGASRAIYVDQLRADAGLLRLEASRRKLDAENARDRLSAMFPGLNVSDVEITPDVDQITTLLAEPAPDLAAVQAARLSLAQAEARAKRSRLDRAPDPTLGVSYGNEFGGRETSVMATLSIPLGGRARNAASREANARVTSASAELRAAELEATRWLDQTRREALTAAATLQRVETAAATARDAMERLEKGYAMKAVNLGDLITTRRALAQTEMALVEHRSMAQKAYLRLLAAYSAVRVE